MGKLKKTPAFFQPFEGQSKSGRHSRITRSMQVSAAWKALKAISVKLYVYLKLKFDGLNREFTCPYKEIEKVIGLNDRSIKAAFDDLIKKGFIEVVENNRCRMMANVYRFADRWQLWEAEYMPTKKPINKAP